ncbi:MAG: GDP-L-fucose synthase [Parcubacteria group bacterium Gr01-1014_17]|nr:MAG: GDP-L-fucose synthase [Parcubacteria group bacterium Gr01-1014_17]
MNIFVTGGTGFLGRHLVPHLQEKGHRVVVINSKNCDLREKQNLLQFNDQTFDRIYHLAAWTKAGDFCLYHQGEQWVINQQINTNILWFWKEFQEKALMVTMGTSCAYPLGDAALKEENYMADEPDPHLATYAYTKRMLYAGLLAFQMQFGMKFQHLIPSTLYGPKFEAGDNHFIFDLIKKIHAGKTREEEVVLWGTGEQVRELMFVDDAVRLIEFAAELPQSELLNLGSGAGYNIRQYAEMLCEIMGYDPKKIRYDTTKYSGNPKRFFDTTKIKKLFPDFEYTDIREGLRKTVAYYESIV